MPFGKVIPITGLNLGFPGQVSRLGKRTIVARQLLSTTPSPLFFGAPAVIVTASDTIQSVADFIVGGGTFTAGLFAGVAVREVQTTLGFPYSPNVDVIGSYLQGNMAELLEEGTITVPLQVAVPGSPVSQGPVYIRKLANGTYPSALVGAFEAVADSTNSILIPGVVWRTSQVDANGMAEITILNRVAA
jgi:hypothetical protein